MVEIKEVLDILSVIEQDNSVPKNVRVKIKVAMHALEEQNGTGIEVIFDRVLQELDDLSDDPNLPSYTRTQIWSVVSTLESR